MAAGEQRVEGQAPRRGSEWPSWSSRGTAETRPLDRSPILVQGGLVPAMVPRPLGLRSALREMPRAAGLAEDASGVPGAPGALGAPADRCATRARVSLTLGFSARTLLLESSPQPERSHLDRSRRPAAPAALLCARRAQDQPAIGLACALTARSRHVLAGRPRFVDAPCPGSLRRPPGSGPRRGRASGSIAELEPLKPRLGASPSGDSIRPGGRA